MKNSHATAVTLAVAALLSACSPDKPPVEAPRPVRTAEIRYDATREANRYAGTVQSRFEVDQAFRVGGKVAQRKVDVGQVVHEGDVLAVLDDADYRLAEEAARQQWTAAVAQARQAESDRKRLGSLKADGSVSVADDEHAHSGAQTAQATEEAQARQLELARNRVKYTVLRASRSGVRHCGARRGWPGGRRRPAGGRHRRPRHAGDRRRRAGRPADRVQEGPLQGLARERAGRALRGGAARAVAAGRGADTHLPRPAASR